VQQQQSEGGRNDRDGHRRGQRDSYKLAADTVKHTKKIVGHAFDFQVLLVLRLLLFLEVVASCALLTTTTTLITTSNKK